MKVTFRILAAIVIAAISTMAIFGGLIWVAEKVGVEVPLPVIGAMSLIIGLLYTIRETYVSIMPMKTGNLIGLVVNGVCLALLSAGVVWNGIHGRQPDAMNGFYVLPIGYFGAMVLCPFVMMAVKLFGSRRMVHSTMSKSV